MGSHLPQQGAAGAAARDTALMGHRYVTDPGRFTALREAAETLLDGLAERYMVERRENKEPFGPDDALVRTVRLIPRTPTAAPLAIHFTEPGLMLRFGRWWEEPLPTCGCAACGEDPGRLAERLNAHASALVEGGLWERVRRGVSGSWFEARLIGTGVKEDREGPLSAAGAREARRGGFAAPVQWAPWPLRS